MPIYSATIHQISRPLEELQWSTLPILDVLHRYGGNSPWIDTCLKGGSWLMHMTFIRNMITWCFAYDKRNYATYLSVYCGQMTSLQMEHSEALTTS